MSEPESRAACRPATSIRSSAQRIRHRRVVSTKPALCAPGNRSKTFMRFAVLTSLIPVLLLLAAPPTMAQGSFGPQAIESCHDYVARANSQVQMAKGCSFPGARWSSDPAVHMKWCEAASARERGREDDERRTALVGCRGDAGSVPIKNCNEYAARSRSQVDLAQSLAGCTFEGMRWSANVVQHVNWCNRTPAARHEAEDAARRKELAAYQAGSK